MFILRLFDGNRVVSNKMSVHSVKMGASFRYANVRSCWNVKYKILMGLRWCTLLQP